MNVMTLTWCPDVSVADWLTDAGTDVWQLLTFGPAVFHSYARLRFIPDPTFPGQDEADVDDDDIPDSEADLVREALDVLARHTTTPDDCYFCLWEGSGTLHGGDGLRIADFETRTVTRGPLMAPAFDTAIMDGPKVSIPQGVRFPDRAYYLFRGSLTDFGDYGQADYLPGMPRTDMPNPAFVWPADRTWCFAKDVDPHWAGIGADRAAISDLLAAPGLDVVPADPAAPQPAYR